MHQTSGRWQLGLMLSLTTALFWGMLPIALKGIMDSVDSYSITWYRFLVSLILVALILYRRDRLPNFKWINNRKFLSLFLLVIFGLCANYILYLLGLELITPSAAQVVIQLAPLLLLIGGIFVFKETFSLAQWIGVALFLFGLILFFNHRIETILTAESDYSIGIGLIVLAAITWVVYALAQKQLLIHYGSQQIMLIVYVAASIIFLPTADILSFTKLNNLQSLLLFFCCINTIIAYGCFAEALEHWEASRVGAVITITPLFTIGFAYLTNKLYPEYMEFEPLNWLSLLGAIVLVAGSLLTALSRKKV